MFNKVGFFNERKIEKFENNLRRAKFFDKLKTCQNIMLIVLPFYKCNYYYNILDLILSSTSDFNFLKIVFIKY